MFGMRKNKKLPQEPKVNTEKGKKLKAEKSSVQRESLLEQIKTIDFNETGEWGFGLKVITWFGITAIVTAAGSFILVKPIFDQIAAYEAERPQALETLKAKELEFKRVEAYQLKLDEMDKYFKEQLLQLPKESEIPDLVQDVTHSARSSGFSIVNVGLDQEKNTGIVIEQPITVNAAGEFRAFGRFVESISQLSRIVNIDDFTIETDASKRTPSHMLPHVTYTIQANTYRYFEPVEPVVASPQATAEVPPQPEAN